MRTGSFKRARFVVETWRHEAYPFAAKIAEIGIRAADRYYSVTGGAREKRVLRSIPLVEILRRLVEVTA